MSSFLTIHTGVLFFGAGLSCGTEIFSHITIRLIDGNCRVWVSLVQVWPCGNHDFSSHSFSDTSFSPHPPSNKTGKKSDLSYPKSGFQTAECGYVLAGTYELLAFRNLSAQLSRRSRDIHFPRYQTTSKDDIRAFKTVLQAFERHLPVEEMPDLVTQWQDCYARTTGCIGILKEWLLKALAEALETQAKTILPELLAHHAPSLASREQMLTEIEEGEQGFLSDQATEDALRKRLGVPRQRTVTDASPMLHGESREQKPPPKRSSSVGHRSPSHDPVKGGATTDGEACQRAL